MSDVDLDGMPRGVLPGICDGELRAAAFNAEGDEVEVRWNLSEITAGQAARMAREFAELAEMIAERGAAGRDQGQAEGGKEASAQLAARILHFLSHGRTLPEARSATRSKPNGSVSVKPMDELLAASPWNGEPWSDGARQTIERLYEEARAVLEPAAPAAGEEVRATLQANRSA